MANKSKILVVDDTLASLKLLSDILKAEGYEVRSAICGELAVESAINNPPELVLLDISMPGMDGFEVCRRLKAHPNTRYVPVIFVSALSDTDEKVQGFGLGAVDFVTKPYQREELLARVGTHLEINRLRNHLKEMVEERSGELMESEKRLSASLDDLIIANVHLRTLLDTIPDLIWLKDPEGVYLACNRQFEHFYGAQEAEIIGKTDYDFVEKTQADCIRQNDHDAMLAGKTIAKEERLVFTDDGYRGLFEILKTPIADQAGKLIGVLGIARDITERKAAEEEIKKLAYYDPLTQLPNRQLLMERLKYGIEIGRREGRQLALLMVDLDRFKAVNDNYGHQAGDKLLQQVSERLKNRLRAVDTIARWGGDEFVVLLENITHSDDAGRVAEEILAELVKPFQFLQCDDVRIGASIGICLYPQHADNVELLLDYVDAALYLAKDQGRGGIAYFSEDITRAIRERIALEARLRRAIGQQELRVFYQPQIDIDSGHLTGAEALVRWQDPNEGLIPPSVFITIAEESNLIVKIGEWVLRETCRQGRQWLDMGLPSLTLAVNVSSHQFRRSDINALVATVLTETGFPAGQLELEITESGLMANQDNATAILNKLHDQGIRLAIDDFGTGYSSLAYLKHFPLDVLKIDKSFIDEIPHNKDDMEIAATIVAIGHTLGFKVLAEGVETPEQLAFLQKTGCDSYQGYIKSRPIPATEFVDLLLQHQVGLKNGTIAGYEQSRGT